MPIFFEKKFLSSKKNHKMVLQITPSISKQNIFFSLLYLTEINQFVISIIITSTQYPFPFFVRKKTFTSQSPAL